MELSERDQAALLELGDLGLATTDIIWQRHYTPSDSGLKYCQRRLKQFAEAGLTEIIPAPFNVNGKFRKGTAFHRLTKLGAEALFELTGRESSRPGRSDPPGQATLLHRLGCVRFRLLMDESCRDAGITTHWIMEQDRYPVTERNWPKRRQFVLYESWDDDGKRISVYPDGAVLMVLPGGWQLVGLLEYDRSSETHGELLAKVPGYQRYVFGPEKSYRNPWPQIDRKGNKDACRILFVCKSRQRQQNIAETFSGTAIGRLIRIAVESDLSPATAVSAPVWMDGQRERKAIWPKR